MASIASEFGRVSGEGKWRKERREERRILEGKGKEESRERQMEGEKERKPERLGRGRITRFEPLFPYHDCLEH